MTVLESQTIRALYAIRPVRAAKFPGRILHGERTAACRVCHCRCRSGTNSISSATWESCRTSKPVPANCTGMNASAETTRHSPSPWTAGVTSSGKKAQRPPLRRESSTDGSPPVNSTVDSWHRLPSPRRHCSCALTRICTASITRRDSRLCGEVPAPDASKPEFSPLRAVVRLYGNSWRMWACQATVIGNASAMTMISKRCGQGDTTASMQFKTCGPQRRHAKKSTLPWA